MKPENINLKHSPTSLAPIVLAYERRFRRYGCTPRGVFWKNTEWQRQRYDIMVRVFDRTALAGGVKIHDFGCGYGAFFDYLAPHPAMRASHYIGTDMCGTMLDAAHNRISDPRASFTLGFSAKVHADYTFVSGTFNMKRDADNAFWDKYIRTSLLRLWQHTRRGFAFNLLSVSTEVKHNGLHYAESEDYVQFARTHMDPEAKLIIEPPLPDFTILAKRR